MAGHPTSISLEDIFWERLKQHAAETNSSVPALVTRIDESRGPANLSSAIRVYLFELARAGSSGAVGT